jgi:hypothetical protein
MTCTEAKTLVASAVVISTGRYTYERFAAHGGRNHHHDGGRHRD